MFDSGFDEVDFGTFAAILDPIVTSQITLTSAIYGSIILTNIEMGNNQQLINGQVEQSNIAGEVSVLKQSYWPSINKLYFRLNNIRPCDNLDIILFFENTIGEQLTLIDHAGIEWIGVIVTPQTELTLNHSNSIALEFEGIIA